MRRLWLATSDPIHLICSRLDIALMFHKHALITANHISTQRCYEFEAIAQNPSLMEDVLPLDARYAKPPVTIRVLGSNACQYGGS